MRSMGQFGDVHNEPSLHILLCSGDQTPNRNRCTATVATAAQAGWLVTGNRAALFREVDYM